MPEEITIPRICPKCGKIYMGKRMRCNNVLGIKPGGGEIRCETVTIPYVPDEVEPEPEVEETPEIEEIEPEVKKPKKASKKKAKK